MRSFLKGGKYSYKTDNGHRSGLEDKVANQIKEYEQEVYELSQIRYKVPATEHTYTPDFVLGNGIIIECKGLFESADRQKHLRIKSQYPNLDIRFVFTNSKNKLYKGSKTTYEEWCRKNGYRYANKLIPDSWFREEKKDTTGLVPKRRRISDHMLTFKRRERTEAIRLSFNPEYAGQTKKQITDSMKRKGKLNLGYQYLLRDNGALDVGIDFDFYADYELEGYKDSVYVLVQSESLSDAQRHTLRILADALHLPIIEK